jgi:hypothetical protein
MSGRSRRPALVHAAHVVHGGALLLRPAAVAARVDGGAGDRRAVAVVRVLGARHLAQGSAGLVASSPASSRLGAAVDGLHAASMVGLALLDREHRRAAAASALVALAFALAGRWAGGGAD